MGKFVTVITIQNPGNAAVATVKNRVSFIFNNFAVEN